MLDAYGWTEIRSTCEFLLEYEADEEDDEPRLRKGGREGSPGATAGRTKPAM